MTGFQKSAGYIQCREKVYGCVVLHGGFKGRSRALHLGRSNSLHQYRLGADLLKNSSTEKNMDTYIDIPEQFFHHDLVLVKKGKS